MISLQKTLAIATVITALIISNSETLFSQQAWKPGGNDLQQNSDNTIGTKSTSTITDFSIITDGDERITVLGDNGYVGIGTTTPGCSFDVEGDIRTATLSGFGIGIATFADDGILQPLSFTGSTNDVLLGDGSFTSTSTLGFLSLTGGTLTGNLTVNGSVDASSYTLNGVPLASSHWTKLSNDLYYNLGKVAIGKNTAPLAALDIEAAAFSGQEAVLRATTSDATGSDFFLLSNATGNPGELVMNFNGHRGSNNGQTMFIQASITAAIDDSIRPLMSYIAKQLNGTVSSPIQTRPLFEWRNYREIHMLMNTDGDVKIGDIGTYGQSISTTDYPSEKLDVGGNLRVRGTADALAYTVNGVPLQGSQWSYSGNDIYFTGGKVGIGTATPNSALEVIGQLNVDNRIKVGTSSLILESDPSGIFNSIYTTDDDIFIQSQNDFNTIISQKKESRVGIGTLSPQKKLHIRTVHTGVLPSSSSHQGIRLEDLTVANTTVFTSVWDLEPEYDNGMSFLNIGTPSSPKMTITEQGHVGIGTVTPLQKLHVQGNAIVRSTLALVGPGSGIEGGELILADPGQTEFGETNSWAIDNYRVNNISHLRFFYDDANPNAVLAMSILSNGKVGIGTLTPSARLEIQIPATSNERVAIFGDSQGRNLFLISKLGVGGYATLSQSNDVGIFWEENNTGFNNTSGLVLAPSNSNNAGMRIGPDGRVGIGTGNPQALLQVSGQNGKAIIGDNSNNIVLGFDGSNSIIDNFGAGGLLINFYSGHDVVIGAPSGQGGGNANLKVNGTIEVCDKLTVLTSSFCDYVFEPEYNRKTPMEKEQFYSRNKHLIGLPSGADIERNGMDVGEVIVGVTQNVEENSLDIIDMYKRMSRLEKENQRLNKIIRALDVNGK